MPKKETRPHYRTVFLSDLHLGSSSARASDVARMLKTIRCEKLYLVGDIIDMWRLRQRWYWPDEHNDVVRRILKHAHRGTQVIYIPGNHDEYARQYIGLEFGGVKVLAHDVHRTADGRHMLVTHGDQFDLVIRHSRLLSVMGAMAYEWLIRVNTLYNKGRSLCGLKYWSLSQYIKGRVKKACTFISRFEDVLIEQARREGMDGVICGHIHHAESRTIHGLQYINCGDWVESGSMAVEHRDGRLEVIQGMDLLALSPELPEDDDLGFAEDHLPINTMLAAPGNGRRRLGDLLRA